MIFKFIRRHSTGTVKWKGGWAEVVDGGELREESLPGRIQPAPLS